MTYYLESAALRSSPLKILREQLRSFFAATMAEKKPHQEVLINQETINQQAERLLTDYGNNVLRLAYAYLHNMNDAEEILQDTLIQFLKTAPMLDSPKHEKAWLLRVAANLSKNRIDYNQRRLADELNEELVAEEREDLSFVWEEVKALPINQREAVHLFYYEGYTTAEIGKMLGRRESTVRSDLRRGRARLQGVLKEAYDEIMEKIKVTSEMRQHVLERIAREDIIPSKAVRFSALKKYLSVAACLVLLLAGVVTLSQLLERTEPEPPVLTVPNIVEAASLQELSGLVGFEVTTEFSLPFEVEKITYCSYWNEMAEIEYSGRECFAIYRQSIGSDDNSGDYNTYSDMVEIAVNNQNVTLKGNDGAYVLGIWTDGNHSYSLSISPGVSAEDWQTILQH